MLPSPGEKIPPAINPNSTPETAAQQPVIKCPRCDSPNTKFCYYNNYSLSQPRHFCKSCRRYWTKGGALRNVPVGGGCRKNKKLKTSSFITSSSRTITSSLMDDHLISTHASNSNNNNINNNQMSSSEFGFSGLRFLHGVVSPAIDFQLGTSSFSRATTTAHNTLFHQFSSFSELPQTNNTSAVISAGGIDLTSNSSFQYPSCTISKQHGDGNLNGNYNISLASSIESLSSMNQELHWKLQQQRIAMLYDSSAKKQNTDHTNNGVAVAAEMVERPLQPIMFHSLETTTTNEGPSSLRKDAPTEWFFDGSFAPGPVATTPTNSGGNGSNENGDRGDGGRGGGGRGGFGGVQLWSDLPQFTGLPLN